MTSPVSGAGLSSVMQSAAATINQSVAGVSRDAAAVAGASMGDGGEQMLSALLDSKQQLMYTQAGARMMETAGQMLGTLIDISA
jgi:hypothetical protein